MAKRRIRDLINSDTNFSQELVKNFYAAEKIARSKQIECDIYCVIYSILKNFEERKIMTNLTSIVSSKIYFELSKQYHKKRIYDYDIVAKSLVDFVDSIFYLNQKKITQFDFIYLAIENNEKVFQYYYEESIEQIKSILQEKSGCKEIKYIKSTYKQEFKVKDGEDLTFKAYNSEFEKCFGRIEELKRIKRILCKKNKNNPLLLGEPGVGKTHIIEQLAIDLVNGDVPKVLNGYKIIQLKMENLVSGTKYRGDLEQKISSFFSIIKNQKVIVFIDEVHLIEKNGGDNINIGDCIKEYFLKPEYKIIGATTYGEYRILEKSPAIQRRFDIVNIIEPTILETIDILINAKENYELYHNIIIPDNVIKECAKLSDRYITASSLPDKAFDILDEACTYAVHELSEKLLKEEHVYKVITEKTGIPLESLTVDEQYKLITLEEEMNKKIVGQATAIKQIVDTIKRFRLGLNNLQKPIGTFLFAGKTGVGKTETAKVLAELYFGDKKALIKIDMSEYMNKESVQRLIGSPPGYVGYEEGGQLTEAVKHKPYSIVLFDEIEKAHHDVLNILLQILDEGRLTDNKGKTISFKNTIIILTTNIGSNIFNQKNCGFIEQDLDEKNKDVLECVKKVLSHELYNRIRDRIVFNSLNLNDCIIIVNNYMKSYSDYLLKDKGIEVLFKGNIAEYFVNKYYSEYLGAREIVRVFENEIGPMIADEVIEYGNSISITIEVVDNKLAIYRNNTIPKNVS